MEQLEFGKGERRNFVANGDAMPNGIDHQILDLQTFFLTSSFPFIGSTKANLDTCHKLFDPEWLGHVVISTQA